MPNKQITNQEEIKKRKREYAKNYRAKNKEKLKEYSLENKEKLSKIRMQNRESQRRRRERLAIAANNVDKQAVNTITQQKQNDKNYHANYYAKNKETILKTRKKSRSKNIELQRNRRLSLKIAANSGDKQAIDKLALKKQNDKNYHANYYSKNKETIIETSKKNKAKYKDNIMPKKIESLIIAELAEDIDIKNIEIFSEIFSDTTDNNFSM